MAGRQTNGTEADDLLVMKLAATDGEILWQSAVSGPSRQDDRAWAIVVDAQDDPIVTGVVGTPVDPALYVTCKFDGADGDEIWRRDVSGAVNHIDRRAGWLALCDDGDVVMANRTWAGDASYDVVLQRYAAADGETVWATQYDSPQSGPDDPLHMVRDAAGDLLVAGNAGGDWMALKFAAADGGLVWESVYDGPAGGYDSACHVTEGPAGEVVLCGFTDGGATSWDVSTVAFDPLSGAMLWEMHHDAGDAQADEATAVVSGATGDAYVLGYGYRLATGSDMLALRYDLAGSTAIAARPAAGAVPVPVLVASPNPFARSVSLALDGIATGRAVRVAVHDAQGRHVVTLDAGASGGDGAIAGGGGWRGRWEGRDARGKPCGAGVYFVRVEGAGTTVTRKLVLAP
ncbi:MAG: PQQ-binding-like beta-propeller repeat protein [Candidatus Eiseniibacteriota bacterium]